MEFRVKHVEGIGYWPQVKICFGLWKRIGSHVSGFGLYPEESTDYPHKSAKEAQNIIVTYADWRNRMSKGPTYTRYKLVNPR